MLEQRILEQLFRQNYSKMIHLARVLLGNDKEAEDVIQDIFLRVADSDIPPKNDSYLLIGMGCTPEDSGLLTDAEEKALSDEFGDHFISLQKWMSIHGTDYANEFLNAGLEPSQGDLDRMAAGYTPYCLLNEDRLHYTPLGYKVIGYMIYDEMDSRGYFDGLKALEKEYAACITQ